MVVGFLLARKFVVCSFLTRRESLFILACIRWSVHSSWWPVHLTQGEWFTLMLFVCLLWRFSIRVETSELFARGPTFSRSQERSCVSVVNYVFPQSGNRVCFSYVLDSPIMFWGCCLPRTLCWLWCPKFVLGHCGLLIRWLNFPCLSMLGIGLSSVCGLCDVAQPFH